MDALVSAETPHTFAATGEENANLHRRLDAKLAYGIALAGGRWTGTLEVGLGLTDTHRETSLRWRLNPTRSNAYELGLASSRHEPENSAEAPEHRVGVRLIARW